MRVQVHLRAEKLGNIAKGRWRGKKSNPYASVSLGGSGSATVEEVGKTEVLHNNLNPQWSKIFIIEHDEDQAWTPLKITLYDSRAAAVHKSNANRQNTENPILKSVANTLSERQSVLMPSLYKSTDPMMGEVDVEVGEILKMEGQELKLHLDQGGDLYVHITQSEETHGQSDQRGQSSVTSEFHCHIRGLDIENIEKGILGLGAIDPYFTLSKKYTDHKHGITRYNIVYRSEHIPNIINPYWHPFKIDLEKLCHGNLNKELKLEIWDHQRGARRDRWLGECVVSVEWLQKSLTQRGNASREGALSILNDEQEVIGVIVVLKADIL